jgi:AraC-like DNA-binding protein
VKAEAIYDPAYAPAFMYSAESSRRATSQHPGLTCRVQSASYSGTSVLEVSSSKHVFTCMLDGSRLEVAAESWDGGSHVIRRMSAANESLFVPRGRRFVAQYKGSASLRYVVCELDDSTFARALGIDARDLDLRAYSGPSPIGPGIAERLESLCLAPHAFCPAYVGVLTSMLALELYRALGTNVPSDHCEEKRGPARFQVVLDFIEQHLDRDLTLAELAALADLSVPHFSHAFKATYGVPPYRYILQRRIERAKVLLRTADDTIASIAARVGFPSQSRLSRVFSKATGSTPSAYRAAVATR